MDLSALLGSGGNGNLLGVLLPLLLAGKTPDVASLLGGKGGTANPLTTLLAGVQKKEDPATEYPPLFGEKKQEKESSLSPNDLLKALGGLSKKEISSPEKAPQPEYPYELQYNRPYRKNESPEG